MNEKEINYLEKRIEHKCVVAGKTSEGTLRVVGRMGPSFNRHNKSSQNNILTEMGTEDVVGYEVKSEKYQQ